MPDPTVRIDLTAYVNDRTYHVQLEAPAHRTPSEVRRQVIHMADNANSYIATLMEDHRG
jgi:hypothetical protein